MGYVKGSWAACGENVWIISWFMTTSIYDRWLRNTRHTSIRNDRIKGLNSKFLISMNCQDQSQPADASPRRQSLVDCITVIRVRRIWTDAHRFRSRNKRTRVNIIYRWSRYEIELSFAACDRHVCQNISFRWSPYLILKYKPSPPWKKRTIPWWKFQLKNQII